MPWQERQTPQAAIDLIDQLLDEHTYRQATEILTRQGITSGEGNTFTAGRLRAHCDRYRLRSHYQRLRESGLLTLNERAMTPPATGSRRASTAHENPGCMRSMRGAEASCAIRSCPAPPDATDAFTQATALTPWIPG